MAAAPQPRNPKSSNVRKTPANRRRGQHLLDVSVRSDQAARQRKRRLLSLFSKFLLAFGLAAGIYFGVMKVVTSMWLKNPEYNVTELNVETDGVLDAETVLQAADLHKGENIYLLNLSRAKARIEAIPEVEKVQVTRQPPSRIAIQINERKPVAWIASGHGPATREQAATAKNVYFIDARGILLQPRKVTPQDAYLPLIRSYSGGPLAMGRKRRARKSMPRSICCTRIRIR